MNKYTLILIFFLLPGNIYFFGKTLNYYLKFKEEKHFIQNNYENYVDEYIILNSIYKKSPQIVFVGDSIMRRYAVDEYFPKTTVVNRGIFHDTSTSLLERWNSTVSTLLPDLIVLMIGTNDILKNREEFIVQNIGILLDNSTPNSIIVSSIPPFGSIHCEHNKKVLKINKELKNLVESKNQYWIDAYFDLLDETGCLSQALSADGIHLNGKGYSILTSHLKKIIQ
jgi:lysophospholipase L1-like esterase